jgi:hypothetical protein
VVTRSRLRLCLFVLTCLLVVAVGEWGVQAVLTGRLAVSTPAPEDKPNPTVEELLAQVERMRAERKDLERQEHETVRQLRNRRWELEQEERALLVEIRRRLAEQGRKAQALGSDGRPVTASAARNPG